VLPQSSVTDLSGNTYLAGNLNAGSTAYFDGAAITNTLGNAVLFVTKYNAAGQAQWARQFNNDAPLYDPYLAMDSNGNLYITGYFQNSGLYVDGHPLINSSTPTYNDIYILKLDNQANVLWAHSAGGFGHDVALGIAVDADNDVYITGYYSPNAVFGGVSLSTHFGGLMVVRYDGNGNVLGAAKAGGLSGGARGTDIAIGTDHNIYVTGYCTANRSAFDADTLYTSDSLSSPSSIEDAVFARLKGNRLNNGAVGIQTQEFSQGGIHVYPNPASGHFKIETSQPCAVNVFNDLGETVFSSTITGTTAGIDLHDLPDGIYYLRAKNDKGVSCLKLVKN